MSLKNKPRLLLQLLALILALGSWPRGTSAAEDDKAKAAEYTKFWRTVLAESSGISEAVLAPLIEVNETEISTWDSGKTFRVRYTIKMDWLMIKREDRFMVWINESESGYRHLGLPRDTWLSGPELRKVIGKQVSDSAIGRVNPNLKPVFTSLAEAQAFVCKENHVASLDRAEVTFDVPGKIPHDDGQPYLVWFAVRDDTANRGLRGYLNLVTKGGKSWEDAIRVNAIPQGGGFDAQK